ncbi:hypothetical protein KKH18_00625, partial [bacterium]|nr:hypothetical protein [bacterium]
QDVCNLARPGRRAVEGESLKQLQKWGLGAIPSTFQRNARSRIFGQLSLKSIDIFTTMQARTSVL